MTSRATLTGGASRLAVAAVLAALGLAACNQASQPQQAAAVNAPTPLSALPLVADASAPAMVTAPPASALPPATPARIGRLSNPGDTYAFADRAYAMNAAFGDAPPDYTFDDGGGERPWVWRGDDQSMRVAEPLPGGGYRYYYYEPGAQTPYLVRDPDYSYGYENGELVVAYDAQGRPLTEADLARHADVAGRFLARADAIFAASQREHREAVAEANWAAQRSKLAAERAQWAQRQAADQAWHDYHAQHEQAEQAQWDAERYRREAEAARFAITVNDTQQADHDWKAARDAQARAVAAGKLPPPPQGRQGGFGGPHNPPPQAFSPPPPAAPQGGAGTQFGGPNGQGQGQDHHGHPGFAGPPQQGGNPPPNGGQNGDAQIAAQRRAQAEAQAAAAAQAHAAAQANAARQAQIAAQLHAQSAAQAAAVAQGKARQGQVDAQNRARLAAQSQAAAAAQANAQHQAQSQAELRAKALAQSQAQANAKAAAAAQANAAHQAQIATQQRQQAMAKVEAARQAAEQAKLKAGAPPAGPAAHAGPPPTPTSPPPHHHPKPGPDGASNAAEPK